MSEGGDTGSPGTPSPIPRELPDGTVTFVMTDVVGSTELWERSPREMREAMVLHDRLVETSVGANSGMLVRPRGEGDSRFAVFRRASGAVAAAAQLVGAIEGAEWGTPEPIRVRVGVHTGEADLRDGDYYGTAVNLCARIRGLAQPNRVLISEATSRLLMRSDSGVELHEVGAYELKGISLPERVFSLGPAAETVPSQRRGRMGPPQGVSGMQQRFWSWRSRWLWGAIVLVVVGAVIAAVITSGSNGNSPTGTQGAVATLPTGYTPKFEKVACAHYISNPLPTATCGFLVVPQDRTRPKGRQVHVSVTIVPALAGVPTGGSPTIDLDGADSLVSSPARSHSEIINVETRGLSPDTPTLNCPEVAAAKKASLAQPTFDPTTDSAEVAAYAACYSRLVRSGIEPADYNYDSMAEDVVDLLAVLHIRQADIVADDYFSHIAYGVLEKVPGSVRTLTLDNPEPPGQGQFTDPVAALASSFQRYISLCDANTQCASDFPDLSTTYEADQGRFAQSPVLAQTVQETHNLPVLLDGGRMAQALDEALSTPADLPSVAAGIADGPPGLIADLVDSYRGTDASTPWGFGASIVCSYDTQTFSDSSELSAQQLPAFDGVENDTSYYKKLCAVWKVASLPDVYFDGVASLVPTLIVSGSLSPLADESWPNDTKQDLQSATLGQFATLTDDVLGTAPPCLSALRRQFLARPRSHLNMAACTAQSPPIHFVDTP